MTSERGGGRNSIDQGFIRAELASIADKNFTRVYEGAHANGTVAASKVTNAIENYQAAISCFVRSLPSLTDERSVKLVRDEIRRLMNRLHQLQEIHHTLDPTAAAVVDNITLPLMEEDKTRLFDLKFKVGDQVSVDNGHRVATIIQVSEETGLYTLRFSDGQREEESNVKEVRLTLFSPLDESVLMRQLWSEIVESEREYCMHMKSLVVHYLIPLDSPMQWIGEKSKTDTVFTQKTLTELERKTLFGNVEDLAGTSEMCLRALEERFALWDTDQQLASVFLELRGFLVSPYAEYADAYFGSAALLDKMKKERSSFDAIEMRAQREFGCLSLKELMRLPLDRPKLMGKLLLALCQRTSKQHPDYDHIQNAYLLFGQMENAIALSLNRVQLEKQVEQVERQFNPPISLKQRNRRLCLFAENLKRLEGGTAQTRAVWLFSDLLVVGRKSEWFALGFYRLIQRFPVALARNAPEFGPLAFEISGAGNQCVFVAQNAQEKKEWLFALRGFLPSSLSSTAAGTVKKKNSLGANTQRAAMLSRMASSNKQLGKEELWVRAQAKFSFELHQCQEGNLPFKKGDFLKIVLPPENSGNGWAKARLAGKEGTVPLNFLQVMQ